MRGEVGLWRPSSTQLALRARVAQAFGFDPAAMVTHSRRKPVVRARQAAVWVLKARWPKLSLNQLAALMARSDHSTVIHALSQAEVLRERDMVFHALTQALAFDLPLPKRVMVPAKLVAPAKVVAPAEGAKRDPKVEAEYRELLRPERCPTICELNGRALLSAAEIEARRSESERRRRAHVTFWLGEERRRYGAALRNPPSHQRISA